MNAITTGAFSPSRVIAPLLGALAKAVTQPTRTPGVRSTGTTAISTTAISTPNPYARANSLPRFAR